MTQPWDAALHSPGADCSPVAASSCSLPRAPGLVPPQAETELLKVHQMQLLEKEHSGCAALLRDDKVGAGAREGLPGARPSRLAQA